MKTYADRLDRIEERLRRLEDFCALRRNSSAAPPPDYDAVQKNLARLADMESGRRRPEKISDFIPYCPNCRGMGIIEQDNRSGAPKYAFAIKPCPVCSGPDAAFPPNNNPTKK